MTKREFVEQAAQRVLQGLYTSQPYYSQSTYEAAAARAAARLWDELNELVPSGTPVPPLARARDQS